jgi:hypothetical protein
LLLLEHRLLRWQKEEKDLIAEMKDFGTGVLFKEQSIRLLFSESTRRTLDMKSCETKSLSRQFHPSKREKRQTTLVCKSCMGYSAEEVSMIENSFFTVYEF